MCDFSVINKITEYQGNIHHKQWWIYEVLGYSFCSPLVLTYESWTILQCAILSLTYLFSLHI